MNPPPTRMNTCDANRAVSLEVKSFIENVGDIKEETITDFLVWKWRELDRRFNYLRVTPFDHHQESTTTGADFDLELWLVGRKTHVSLAVQAKKFLKRNDSYITKLRYPDGTKSQMNKLLAYAKANGRLPFYFIYSLPETTTKSMCRGPEKSQSAIFMADAFKMEEYADGKHGKRISRDELLKSANPFHCIFCCPLIATQEYFRCYFPTPEIAQVSENEALPSYVKRLLAIREEVGVQGSLSDRDEYDQVKAFRAVGVYDMRGDA